MKTAVKGKKLILALLAVVLICCGVYAGDYYRADTAAIAAFAPAQNLRVQTLEGGAVAYLPEGQPHAGWIFYPGGKVEAAAYEPLMRACAAQGLACVLVEMPLNLAVLDIKAADGVREQLPQVERWYMGGHSLGGAMASSYLGDRAAEFEGLILLGAYAAEDLSHTALQVFSVYGSEDGVLNREKYEESRKNLPTAVEELVIDGGCHAYFGMYGAQQGDGTPRLTPGEQIRITAKAVADFTA